MHLRENQNRAASQLPSKLLRDQLQGRSKQSTRSHWSPDRRVTQELLQCDLCGLIIGACFRVTPDFFFKL